MKLNFLCTTIQQIGQNKNNLTNILCIDFLFRIILLVSIQCAMYINQKLFMGNGWAILLIFWSKYFVLFLLWT